MKRIYQLSPLSLVLLAVAVPLGFWSSTVTAVEGPEPARTTTSVASEKDREGVEKDRQASRQKERIAGKKLEICQQHTEHITSTMKNLSTRGSEQFTVFEKIAARTQEFVTKKQLAVANYHELVSTVNTTHAAAKAASEKVQTLGSTWSCSGDSPKASAAEFKLAKRDQITALKAYKTAVKNLIVAVKSAAATKGTE